jgi:hypothetical protein
MGVQHLCLEDEAHPPVPCVEPPFPVSTRPDLLVNGVLVDKKRWMFTSQGEHVAIGDAGFTHPDTQLASVCDIRPGRPGKFF